MCAVLPITRHRKLLPVKLVRLHVGFNYQPLPLVKAVNWHEMVCDENSGCYEL